MDENDEPKILFIYGDGNVSFDDHRHSVRENSYSTE
jgi:hypothetical protein